VSAVVVSPVLPLVDERVPGRERYTWVRHVDGGVLFFQVDERGHVYRRTFRGRRR
jgi:hypothetical protein